MKVPYSWLCQLLPDLPARINNDPKNLEPILAMLGTGLEEMTVVPAVSDGVIFAVVQTYQNIPETNLKKLIVEIAAGTTQTIVTAAPNARPDIGVVVATPGTQLGELKVGVRNLQGIDSWGMVCSAKELGVGEYGAGLLELPKNNAAPGTKFKDMWASEIILDIEVTPNRADALSVLGVARDLAAKLELQLKEPSRGEQSKHQENFLLRVSLDPKKDCDRFVARVAKNATLAPSPAWLQRNLNNAGMRPINNVVDASNYVMLELGQPTAAYDLQDVPELNLVVRDAKPNEPVLGLTDAELQCDANDLLVATHVNAESKVVGLGGILGAKYSSINANTKDVILEAAHWNAVRLRLTGRKHGLKTDALYRFERGVDPNLPVWAADRYMELLQEIAGAEIVPGHRDVGGEKARHEIVFRPGYCNEFLGTNYKAEDMERVLKNLGFEIVYPGIPEHISKELVQEENLSLVLQSSGSAENVSQEKAALIQKLSKDNKIIVRPPTYRVNMDLEEDVIEEVARMLGYDAIPETLPNVVNTDESRATDLPMRLTRQFKDVIVGLGFQEIVSYSFTSQEESLRMAAPAPVLQLRNPQSSERTHLRSSLYQSLLLAAQNNRGQENVLLFEVGRVFPNATKEEERLALLMTGAHAPKNWRDGIQTDFFVFKGLVEAAAGRLGDDLEIRAVKNSAHDSALHLHPGVAAEIFWNGKPVGHMGALHPNIATQLELPQTFLAEIVLPLPTRAWNFADPLRQPAALRDLAIVAPTHISYADLQTLVRGAAGEMLETIAPFDVYVGKPIPEGSRSVALRMGWRNKDRTLTDAEVDANFQAVIAAVRAAGFEIRDQ